MPDPNEMTPWAEFGLAGLVIFALLALLVFILKLHRDERREWRDEASAQSKEMTAAVNALREALHDRRS